MMRAVAAREVRWILGDPVARFLLFGVPVIAFAVLGFTFSSAVVRGLDVVAVDMDNTATSRLFIQTVAAAPGITIAERGNDLGAAASAIRAGHAIAAIFLPPEFAKDLLAGRAPRPVLFINTQFFTPGNNAGKSIRDAMSAASEAVSPAGRVAGERAPGAGLVPEEYVLANPALNYAQFLLRAVLPTVLHVVIAISAGYAVGSEFRRRSMREWWDLSGRNIATALVGKLLPYYVVLMLMFVLMVGILDVWLGVSFRGNAVLTAVAATLLIIAYQMVGCLMQLLARNMAVGLSLTGIIVSPAFGFAGVGFPVLAMQDFPRAWGAILPLRWYIQILFDQATRGAALYFTAEPFAILCGITLVLASLVWLRFRCAGPAWRHASRGGRSGDRARDARGRRDVRGRVAPGARRSRGVLTIHAGPRALRVLLPAALPGPDRSQDSDRGRGPGSQRTWPRTDPGPRGARQHIGRAARVELP